MAEDELSKGKPQGIAAIKMALSEPVLSDAINELDAGEQNKDIHLQLTEDDKD